MAETKKVRILARVGDPRSGVIIQPGALVELPEFWANRYIANGSAEEVKDAGKPADDAKPKPAPKGKKK